MSISRVAKYSDENEEMVAIMASGSRGQRLSADRACGPP